MNQLNQRFRMLIASTWDGHDIDPGEQAQIVLHWDQDSLYIQVDAPFHNDPSPPGPARSTDRLWDFEVVETFIANALEATRPLHAEIRYTEIELSPHGHFLILKMNGIRHPVETVVEVDYRATIDGNRWQGKLSLPRHDLPDPPYVANAYAIHGTGDARTYLAATPVPGDQADFHQPHLFLPLGG